MSVRSNAIRPEDLAASEAQAVGQVVEMNDQRLDDVSIVVPSTDNDDLGDGDNRRGRQRRNRHRAQAR